MKKLFYLITLFLIFANFGFGQISQKEMKFSSAQLNKDLAYLKHLINDVHVNPNWELSSEQYKQIFAKIDSSLKDSLTATDFLKKIKPIIAYLSDEHSQMFLKPSLLSSAFLSEPIYPPFSLIAKGGSYFIGDLLENTNKLKQGDGIIEINNIPVETWVKRCALDTIGFPEQRTAIALQRFGYLFPLTITEETKRFNIKVANGKSISVDGTTLKVWQCYMNSHTEGKGADSEERLSYKKYGKTGYINACWFDVKSKGKYSLDSIKHKIDEIFKLIYQDGIQKLVIDVSQNGGGNSAVGEYLISSFYDKPYKDYQVDYKKSEDYLKLYESWGFHSDYYSSAPNGQIIHYASQTVTPSSVPYLFKGNVSIIMGKATFSSAMTFVTLIKDNNMAKLIGQASLNGHPTGLGEQFYTNLPNTKIFVRLSVKEFIRPAGKMKDNVLKPDVLLSDSQMSNFNELLNN